MCGDRLLAATLGFEVRGDFVSQLLASSRRDGRVSDVAVPIVQKPTLVIRLFYGMGKLGHLLFVVRVGDVLPLLAALLIP